MQGLDKRKTSNRLGLIYKIILDDKFIIGSTLHFNKRQSSHKCDLRNNKHCNKPLQHVYDKSINKEIVFEILQENIPERILKYVEDVWIGASCSKIQDKRNGLNIIDGSRIDYTPEMREKRRISQTRIMNSLTQEQKEQRASRMKESKSNNLVQIGRNISASKQINKKENWINNQSYPVLQKTLEGIPIKLWASAYHAEKEKNYLSSHVRGVCLKAYGQKTYKGYDWEYIKSEDLYLYENLKDVDVPQCYKSLKNIPVYQYDLDNNLIKEWDNSRRICEHYNLSPGYVSSCISKKKLYLEKYIFSFEKLQAKAKQNNKTK